MTMEPFTVAMALGQLVPGIIKLVTGSDKAEQVAGKVVDIAKAVTGKDSGDDALEAIKADPNKLLEFRQAFAAQEADLEKAYIADRSNARTRDTAIINSGKHNYRADILAFLAVCALCFCVWLVAGNVGIEGSAREAIMFVAGVFAGCVRDVYGFEFGSSRGSKEKDELISKLK